MRFIGDRSIDEKDFGRLQKDRIKELRLWSHSVQGVKNKAKYVIVAVNNHYAGFINGVAIIIERTAPFSVIQRLDL